jgi:digalactosyldiacylglycerol synthase
MCRAHCHRVIKLSGTLGQFAPEKELVENVHGVRFSFLDAGEQVRERLMSDPVEDSVFGANAEPKVYFIGKMLWSKGLGSLMELLKYAEESAGTKVHIDMYGGGPDKDEASAKAELLDVDMEFHGPIDHADLALTHKVGIKFSGEYLFYTKISLAD